MPENPSDQNDLVLVKEYAEKHGDTEENIVQMIRDGALAGRIKGNIWYVDISLSNSILSTSDKSSVESGSESEGVDRKLAGISGWLILPAIGFVLSAIYGVVFLVASLGLYADVSRAGYGGIYAFEIIVTLALLVFTIYAATLFFRKKRNAPPIIITLYIVYLVAPSLLLIVELGAGAEEFAIESGKQLVRNIIIAAIWIPYFKVSKRVKATFVN